MADLSLLNPDELESVNRAIASNITQSVIGQEHPGAATAHPLIFSHEGSSVLDAVIGIYRQGIIKVPASSTNMQANANFTLLNRSILSSPYITGSFTIPEGVVLPSLFYYYAMNQWQLNLSGIGNLSGNGMSMLNMWMRSNPTDRRNKLSLMCPYVNAESDAQTVNFTAPLYLPWNGPGVVSGGYNIDANVSASTFQVSIQLNPQYLWMGGGETGPVVSDIPINFDSYNLKVMNQLDVLNQQFSPAKISSRGLFRLPFPYYQSYPLFSTPNLGPNNLQSLSLQAIPNAELVSILIWGVPSNNKGTPDYNTAVDLSSVTFSYYRLELQGSRLIELESAQEIITQKNYFSVGSSSGFDMDLINGTFTTTTGGVNTYTSFDPVASTKSFTALECFTSNPSNFMDGNGVTQLAQNFSGQIFTFYYRLESQWTTVKYPLIDWFVTYVANGQINWVDGVAKLLT